MTASTLHPLAVEYLDRLRRAGRRLPRGRLRELVAEIEGHLTEAIGPDASDAEALNVLDRLGEPEAIVEAEAPTPPAGDRRGTREWAAIVLLLFGGFVFGVGWLAGLVLLWSSRAWTLRDKLIGTLIWPGGLASLLFFLVVVGQASMQKCTGFASGFRVLPDGARVAIPGVMKCTPVGGGGTDVFGIALLVIAVVAPFATAIYLARRAR